MTIKHKKLKYSKLKTRIVIIIVLILISFGGSLSNKYSLDDELVTTNANNKVKKGLSGLKDIYTKPYEDRKDIKDSYGYRPITLTSFALEKEIFGFNPGISHLINVLLYILVVILVFKLLKTLFPEKKYYNVIFLTVLLFSIHPLHSEVVLSLKNREELFVSLFGFSAFLQAIKYAKSNNLKNLLCTTGLLCIGVLTKTTITSFIILIPITLWFFNFMSLKKSTLLFLGILTITFLTINIPFFIFKIPSNREIAFFENPLLYMPFSDRLPMAFCTFYQYFKLHLVPYPLLSYYGYNQIPLLSWFKLEVVIGISLAITSIILFFKFKIKNKFLSFGILAFIFFLLPFLNFPIPATGIIAERFTFNAVLGFSIIIIYCLHKISVILKFKRFLLFIIPILIVTYSYINIKRTTNWKDKLTLIENDAIHAKNSFKLQFSLGDLYQQEIIKSNTIKKKNYFFDKALEAYKTASVIYEEEASLYNNIGTTMLTASQNKNAILLFEKAVELKNDNALFYYNLGAAYEKDNNIEKAKENYLKALAINPLLKKATYRLAKID